MLDRKADACVNPTVMSVESQSEEKASARASPASLCACFRPPRSCPCPGYQYHKRMHPHPPRLFGEHMGLLILTEPSLLIPRCDLRPRRGHGPSLSPRPISHPRIVPPFLQAPSPSSRASPITLSSMTTTTMMKIAMGRSSSPKTSSSPRLPRILTLAPLSSPYRRTRRIPARQEVS